MTDEEFIVAMYERFEIAVKKYTDDRRDLRMCMDKLRVTKKVLAAMADIIRSEGGKIELPWESETWQSVGAVDPVGSDAVADQRPRATESSSDRQIVEVGGHAIRGR